mgnify:CR=1 FL=1
MDGGVDLLLMETFIDTLNLKAAIKAADNVFEKKNIEYIWNSEVQKVLGDNDKKVVTSLEIFNSSSLLCNSGYASSLWIGIG